MELQAEKRLHIRRVHVMVGLLALTAMVVLATCIHVIKENWQVRRYEGEETTRSILPVGVVFHGLPALALTGAGIRIRLGSRFQAFIVEPSEKRIIEKLRSSDLSDKIEGIYRAGLNRQQDYTLEMNRLVEDESDLVMVLAAIYLNSRGATIPQIALLRCLDIVSSSDESLAASHASSAIRNYPGFHRQIVDSATSMSDNQVRQAAQVLERHGFSQESEEMLRILVDRAESLSAATARSEG